MDSMIELEEELLDLAGTDYFDCKCCSSCSSAATSEVPYLDCFVEADSTDHTTAVTYLGYIAAAKSPCSAGLQIVQD